MRPLAILSLLAGCFVLPHQTLAETTDHQPAAPARLTPADNEFALRARQLEANGLQFGRIFAELCATVLSNTAANPKLDLADQVRSIFGGLWIWGQSGGQPRLQGRHDLALHFIGGGAFEGYWDVGAAAAIIKERADSRGPGARYDLDDLAATMLGARWMNLATAGSTPAQNRHWLKLWATRELTIETSIPPLQFGIDATREGTAQQIEKVWRSVEEMLPREGE